MCGGDTISLFSHTVNPAVAAATGLGDTRVYAALVRRLPAGGFDVLPAARDGAKPYKIAAVGGVRFMVGRGAEKDFIECSDLSVERFSTQVGGWGLGAGRQAHAGTPSRLHATQKNRRQRS